MGCKSFREKKNGNILELFLTGVLTPHGYVLVK